MSNGSDEGAEADKILDIELFAGIVNCLHYL